MKICVKNFFNSLLILLFFLLIAASFPAIAQERGQGVFARGIEAYDSFSDAGINLSAKLFEAAIKETPDFSQTYSALSESYIQQYYRSGEADKVLLKKAFALSEKALLLDAKSEIAHKTLGTAYFASGKLEEAIEEFERAVDMEPNYARAWLNLGSCYYRLGDIKTAASHLARAVELNNDLLAKALGHYNLAVLSYEEGNYRSALSAYEKAKAILPEYHNIYYGIGVTLMQLDRDSEAIALFKKAIYMKSNDADFHVGLASAYHRLGDKAAAKEAYEKALDIDPDRDDARQGLMGLGAIKIGPIDLY